MLFRFYAHWRNSYMGIPRNIWLLSLISLVNRCGSMVISFITLYLTQQLHFSIRDTGYTMSCFGVGALIGAYTGGRLTDKLGYYAVQFWSLIFNGLMLLLLMVVRDFWWMCAAVFVMSLIAELFRPANSVAINRHCTPETRTRSISLYRMAVNLGWTVAPVLGGLLASLGWNWLFWVDGLTCIFAALLLRRLLPPDAEPDSPPVDPNEAPTTDISPYRDRAFLWFVLLSVINAIVFMQFLWTVPVFFKESYGWTEAHIGLVVALNGLIVFVVEMPLIFRIEGRRSPLYFVRIGLALYAVAYLSFNMPLGSSVAALAYIVAISLGEIFVMPFSSNHVYGCMGVTRQGQYIALYMMAYSVANTVAPLLGTQVIAAWGYSALWYLVMSLAGVAWIGIWWMDRRSTPPVPQILLPPHQTT